MKKESARYNILQRVLAIVLTVAMAYSFLPVSALAAGTEGGMAKTSDPSTAMSYESMLGTAQDGNRYAGRIWSDKSVYYDASSPVSLDGNEAVSFDADEFLVVYSALGSTTSVSSLSVGNLDVVVILDNSMSMSDRAANSSSTRLALVTAAANGLIHNILSDSSNRLAVVTYAEDSTTLLPLNNYQQKSAQDYLTISSSSGGGGGRPGGGGRGVMTASAVTTAGTTVSNSNSGYETGTNQQAGIYEGMGILANAADTENRIPVVILLTDGVADIAVSSGVFAVDYRNAQQPGDNTLTPGVALSTILTASYMKSKMEANYPDTNSSYVYSVGVDLEVNNEGEAAAVVLDPANHFNASGIDLAKIAYGWYVNWLEASGSIEVTDPSSYRGNDWTFEQNPDVAKADVEANINYVDAYYSVESSDLSIVFDEIYMEISTAAFYPVVDSVTSEGVVDSTVHTYVDFVGDYMQVNEFKGLTLRGNTYGVVESGSTVSYSDGVATKVTSYVVDDSTTNNHPITGDSYNLSKDITITVTHTYNVNAANEQTSAGEQEVRVTLAKEVLPLIYDEVDVDSEGNITFTAHSAEPLRLYYTVGLSDFILADGTILSHLVDEEYQRNHTVDGVLYFYTNQYNDMSTATNDAGELLYGDAHVAATPSDDNRYYYHQQNVPIYSAVTMADGSDVTWEDGEYGVLYYKGNGTLEDNELSGAFNATYMTYADLSHLEDNSEVYTLISFYRPTGTADENGASSGEAVGYLVYTTWGLLQSAVAYYDSVNGVYINGYDAGTHTYITSDTAGYYVDPDVVGSYIADMGLSANQVYAAIGQDTWRVSRLSNMTETKVANNTDTAIYSVAPTLNTNSIHAGSLVAWLGNNGRLGLTLTPLKQVHINDSTDNDDGRNVLVGDVLTYEITVHNHKTTAADIVVTDAIPVGTAYVAGSISSDYSGSTAYSVEGSNLVWTMSAVPAGEEITLSFQVVVTEDALENAVIGINNTAYIQIGDDPAYETNTTNNPPEGKLVRDINDTNVSEVKVGDTLVYSIRFFNDNAQAATVTITDIVPEGTRFLSADHNGTLSEDGVITWSIADVQPNHGGVVTFTVVVTADAANNNNNTDTDIPADDSVFNSATIQIGTNAPAYETNVTQVDLTYGDLSLTKVVTGTEDASKVFTLVLSDLGSATAGLEALNGTYSSSIGDITFTNGVASVNISAGQTVTIYDLPAGLTFNVTEESVAGYTPTISPNQVTITKAETAAVTVTNDYATLPVSVTLGARKVLNNLTLTDGQFTFVLKDSDGSSVDVAINENGAVVFNSLVFDKAGTYTYTVSESAGSNPNMTYDDTVYTVTVTVSDDGEGQLTASVAVDGSALTAVDGIYNVGTFTNTYLPGEVSVTLTGTKHLTGTAADGLTAGEFSFEVLDENGDVVATGNNAEGSSSAAITFTAINYTLESLGGAGSKTFVYTVKEISPAGTAAADPNMKYDDTEYTVTVTVSYDAASGLLSVSEPVISGGALEFTNIQNPDSITVTPVAWKTTANSPDGVSFSFSVLDANGNVAATGTAAGSETAQKVSFGHLTYTAADVGSTYTYTIQETKAGTVVNNGIAYDSTVYTMTVTVGRDANNALTAAVTYSDANGPIAGEPTFTNTYDAKGYLNITASKVMTGARALEEGDFSFQITDGTNVVATGINDANGSIAFSTIYYTLSDIPGGQATLTYYMSELKGDLAGVTYDDTVYTLTVTLADDGNGNITADYTVDGSGVFTNSYQAVEGVDYEIKASKDLTGRDLIDGEFGFELYSITADGNENLVATTTNAGDGSVIFKRSMPATGSAGTYKYRVSEITGSKGGVTYSTEQYWVLVEIVNDTDTGKLKVSSIEYYSDDSCAPDKKIEASDVVFTNIYKATEVTFTPEVSKVLTGRDLVAGEFGFEILDAHGNVISRGTNDANGKVTFDAITYYDKNGVGAGEFQYTIVEVSGTLGGVTYDAAVIDLTVSVHDDGAGKLVATGAYSIGGQTVESPAFNNSYSVAPAELTLHGNKVLEGKNLEQGEFSFTLSEDGSVIQTVTNAADGTFSFSLSYTEAGTYTYQVAELAQSGSAATGTYGYDSKTVSVTVVVMDDGFGTLYVDSVSYGDTTGIVFQNSYTPAPITLDLNDELEFTKQVNSTSGAGYTPAGFEFRVYDLTGAVVASGTSNAAGIIDFEPDLVYTAPGQYRYTIKEVDSGRPGVTIDTREWEIHVEVNYNADTGALYVDSSEVFVHLLTSDHTDGSDRVEFVNTYKAEPTQLVLDLMKVFRTTDGRPMVMGEFVFQVKDSEGNVIAEGRNQADGSVRIQLSFDQAGTYYYTVSEVNGGLGGVTYDSSVYPFTVTVTDDQASGKLVAQLTSAPGSGEFVNSYSAEPAMVTIAAEKLLYGRPLTAGEFTFELKDSEGNVIASAVNAADGSVVFETLEYTQPGVYEYTLTEQAGEMGNGVTYDSRVYHVTVTVIDNQLGKLVSSVAYTVLDSEGNRVTVDQANFYNQYSADSVSITISGSKTLTGRELADGEFTFRLLDTDGNVLETASNTGNGFAFGAIEYDAAGTHVYTVDEINDGKGGVTYDDTVYTVTVTVSDNGSGVLSADVTYTADGAAAESISFLNSYYAEPVEVQPEGTKTLIGRALGAGEFKFQLISWNGGSQYVTNNADGTLNLPALRFDTPGVYVLTLDEVNGGLTGVTYDTTEYTITITVTDNGEGKLEADIAYSADGSPAEAADFTNTYTALPVSVTLEGTKHLTGEAADGLTEGEFSFEVLDENGTVVATGNNAAGTGSAVIRFTPITYTLSDLDGTDSKRFTYTVLEIVPSVGQSASGMGAADPNMKYDNTVYTVTVTVGYDADTGLLNASVSDISGGGDIVFTNIQNPASVTVTPEAWKVTSTVGSTLPDDATFSFSVINVATGNTVVTGRAPASENGAAVVFDHLTYTAEDVGKTFVYRIEESNAGNTTNGITYDQSKFLMNVTIGRDDNNKLIAAVTYTDSSGNTVDRPSFENVYNAEGYINITAKKELSGRDLTDGEFSFQLKRNDTGNTIDGTLSADGTITFATLYYSGDDIPSGQDSVVIRYTMSELIPTLHKVPGVTYDTNSYPVYVKLTHSAAGKLTAELVDENGTALGSTDTGIVFKNVYRTGDVDVTIQAAKELSGRDLSAGEFSFGLYYKTKAGEWVLVSTATNAADGSITFHRTFPGTSERRAYEYTIRELAGSLGGVTYDTLEIPVAVTIADNGDGTLNAQVTYPDDVTFNNRYEATSGTAVISGTKVLTGKTLAAGDYTFELYEGDTLIERVSNKANGAFSFAAIEYTQAGTYTYTVREVNDGKGGVTYDDTVHTVIVTVTDDGMGDLVTAVSYPSGSLRFRNSYAITGTAELALSGTKTMNGKDLAAGDYRFTLSENGSVIETVTNAADGTIRFSTITYTTPGEHTYTIREVNDEKGGVTYDSTVYTVKVSVRDNGAGGLTMEVVEGSTNGLNFTNTYHADPVQVALTGTKVLTGKALEDKSFGFRLYEGASAIDTAWNDADGTFTFQTITYKTVGTHVYTVKEIPGTLGGVTYDDSVYTVTVEVTDNGKGQLVANVIYPEGGVVFNNSYEAKSVEVGLEAVKTLTGRDLNEGEFSFVLSGNGSEIETVTNGIGGSIRFSAIEYTKVGTYTYTIAEIAGTLGGVTYDDTVYTVTVEVTDNGRGQLVANVIYPEGGVVFGNSYKAKSVEVGLEAVKTLTGRDLNEGEFSFVLKEGNTELETVTNAADGSITFSAIELTQTGTYTYTIAEKAGTLGGVTYDNTVYTVTVEVTDNGKGLLEASVTYPEGGVGFTNVYALPEDASVSINLEGGHKTLTGRDVAENEFTFELVDAEGTVIGTAANDAYGMIHFEGVTFTAPGEYSYTVREVNDGSAGITYDEAEYTITITVVDNLQGALEVSGVVYTTEDGLIPSFVNGYKGEEVIIQINAGKTLTGKTLKEGDYTFELVDASGSSITAVNDANGMITFAVTFSEVGEYSFLLREVPGEDSHVTYDDAEYAVTVTVTDPLNGYLAAEVVYATETGTHPVFENVYTPAPVTVVLPNGTKTLTGRRLAEGEFRFNVADPEGNVVATGTNAADGTITFSSIILSGVGEYVYTVYEENNGLAYVTYDRAAYAIHVSVTNEDGVLVATVTAPEEGISFENSYHNPNSSPKTGDNAPVVIVSVILVTCGACLSFLLLTGKKKQPGEEDDV